MEVDETAENAGQREVEEEVGLRVKPGPAAGGLLAPPGARQAGPGILVVVFRAADPTGRLRIGRGVPGGPPGSDPDDIPWERALLRDHPLGAARLAGPQGAPPPESRLALRLPHGARPSRGACAGGACFLGRPR